MDEGRTHLLLHAEWSADVDDHVRYDLRALRSWTSPRPPLVYSEIVLRNNISGLLVLRG